MYDNISYERRREIESNIKDKNFDFIRTLNLDELNFSFYECCYQNIDFQFTSSVIDLGVTDFNYGLINGCCYQRSYDLLFNIVNKYKNIKKLELFNHHDVFTLISKYITFFARDDKYFSLFIEIINLLPNHTKKVTSSIKNYQLIDLKIYADIYNEILNALLEDKNIKALKILLSKKFPIYKNNRDKILQINNEDILNDYNYRLLDSLENKSFLQRKKFTHFDVYENQKGNSNCNYFRSVEYSKEKFWYIFDDVVFDFKIPREIIQIILKSKRKNITYKIRILDNESYKYIKNLKIKNIRLYNFLLKYIDILYFKLNDTLTEKPKVKSTKI